MSFSFSLSILFFKDRNLTVQRENWLLQKKVSLYHGTVFVLVAAALILFLNMLLVKCFIINCSDA